MGSIKFNKANGRQKRVLPGEDHYTGLVFYSDVLPAGFDENPCVEITDLDAAEALGITADAASNHIKTLHYHIKELFRINPNAVFYLCIALVPVGEHTFDELDALRAFSQNKIRQCGVWSSKAFSLGQIALLQDQYDKAFEIYSMYEIYYSPNMVGIITADFPALGVLLGRNIHGVFGQDGAAAGKALYDAAGFSIGCIGAQLGAVSLAAVHINTGWVEEFNMAVPGGELDVPALSNGVLFSTLANNTVKSGGTLDTKRIIFLKKYPNITGSYFNDTHGCITADDDYAYAEDNRAMDKAIRGVYAKLILKVNGPSLYTKEKKLDPAYTSYLQTEAGKALETMEKAGELSGYTAYIDPDQDSYSTDTITVEITNIKRGVSRNFIINIGF